MIKTTAIQIYIYRFINVDKSHKYTTFKSHKYSYNNNNILAD